MKRSWLQYQDRVLLFLVILSIFVLHALAFGNAQIADDTYFASALNGRSLAEFAAFRYLHWSGRVPIEMALVLIVGHPWLWKLMNGLMLLLLCYSAGRVSLAGTRTSIAASTSLAFALFMLITPAILSESAWWMTGSLNYLWPVALGMYGLIPFVDTKNHGRITRLGFLLASGLAMYNEQVALVLLPASLALLGPRLARRQWCRWNLAQVGFMAANAMVVFGAPGSYRRYLSEQALRFPDFATLDVLDKMAVGFGLVFRSAVDPHNLLMAALMTFAAALLLRSPVGRVAKVVMFGALVLLAINYVLSLPGWPERAALQGFYALPVPGGASASSSRAYALSAWFAFTIACVVVAATVAFWRSHRECAAIFLTLLLGLASLGAMGFSPTAYASGMRVHFVCQVAFLLATARMMSLLESEFGPRVAKAAFALVAVAAGYRVLQLLPW